MVAIILAAGMGRRLSIDTPKCLIDIAGVSIIKRQVAAFRRAGADRFVVVVGYQQDAVRAHLADEQGPFTFITNPRFADTNTIYSLFLAREHFAGGFFFANGDVVFDGRLTRSLLPVDRSTQLAVKPGLCGQEEVKVMVEAGRITRIGKQLDPARSLGEFVGLARFGADLAVPFAEMLTQCVDGEGVVGDHFERALDRLCQAGHTLSVVEVGGLPCSEIDFPEDLQLARDQLAPQLES